VKKRERVVHTSNNGFVWGSFILEKYKRPKAARQAVKREMQMQPAADKCGDVCNQRRVLCSARRARRKGGREQQRAGRSY
jgi:hypothetical protein